MIHKSLPSQEVLLARFAYDANTGALTSKRTGEVIRWVTREGYFMCQVGGKKFFAHRVIYKIVTGEDPDLIDHIDGVKTNNRWENLRSVSKVDNARNTKRNILNTSGVMGVSYHPRDRIWRVHIGGIYKGSFRDLSTAVAARKAAERESGYHPNHGRAA